jgi:nucleotide-binding universal stress UspA family protein
MYDRIVVPVGLEGGTRESVEYALALAALVGGELHLVAVVDDGDVPATVRETTAYEQGEADALARAERILDGLRTRCEREAVPCSTAVRRGEAFETIRRYVETVEGDLCVLRRGERRRTSPFGFLRRPLTERLARSSAVPILSVPDGADRPPYGRLLVATDGQRNSERAERHALSLAARSDATLFAVYVVHARFLDGPLADVLRETGADELRSFEVAAARADVDLQTETLEGPPAREILACAERRDAEAIVVGTSGKRGLDRAVLGSVAGTVFREATVPVFLVPDTDES